MTTTPPEPPPGSPDQPPAAESGAPGSASDTGTATQERPHDSHDDGRDGRDGPRVTGAEVRDLSRLRRSTGDRKVAGVAGGLARHLDVDPLILRVGFVVLAFFGGAGLILYAAIWALVPEEDRDRASVHLDERSRTVALVALGVIAALALVGDSWGAFWFPWPLLVIGVIAFVWLGRQRDDDRSERTDAPWQPGQPAPGVAPGEYAAWDPAGHGRAPAAYVPPRPRDPRKRGPVLFWFTLLLLLVTEGALAIVDAAGGPVADSAYAALAVGVIALMLVVGSFVGRAGGLIALGLVAAVGLVAATAADRWEGERLDYRPTSVEQLRDTYTMDTGSLTLDLTALDPADLDGRTIELRGNVGQIEVVVPEDSNVETDVEISGPGGFDLYDGRYTGGGVGAETVRDHRSASTDPSFTLLADLEVGQVSVDLDRE